MAEQRASRRRPGRPRLNRELHTFAVRLDQPLEQDLRDRAQEVGSSRPAVAAAALSAAVGGYTSPFVLDPADVFPATADQLAAYLQDEAEPERHGALPASGQRMYFTMAIDAALANLVIEHARRLDADYSFVIRAVLRRALGHPLDPSKHPYQGALDLGRVAS